MKIKKNVGALILVTVIFTLFIINSSYFYSKAKSKIISETVDDFPGNAPNGTYPVILLHGFNPLYSPRLSEYMLKDMQDQLSIDLNYSNRGLLIDETTCTELKYNKKPIIVRATYLEKSGLEQIQDYAQNVNKIINKVIDCTGAEKVDIVTHSMGGIVVRYYIKNINPNTIRKFIMLGTPNNGGLYNIGEFAPLLIEEGESKFGLDFLQLSESSNFMNELNNWNEGNLTSLDILYYTIAGNDDGIGDGLVLKETVAIPGAINFEVQCGHIELRYPELCEESYNIVLGILRG